MVVFTEWLGTWGLLLFLTVAFISFAYKDNIAFRIAEHTFTGWSIGWTMWTGITNAMDMNINPLITTPNLLYVLALIFGLLLFAQFYKKISYLVRWPTAIMIGAGLSVFVTSGISGDITSQLSATISLSVIQADPIQGISNLILIIMTIFSILYFFFIAYGGVSEKAPMKQIIKYGRYVVILGLGTYFGSAMMGDAIKFIERISQVFEAIRVLL